MRHRDCHAKSGVFASQYHQGTALSPPAPGGWAHGGVSPGLWARTGNNGSQRVGAIDTFIYLASYFTLLQGSCKGPHETCQEAKSQCGQVACPKRQSKRLILNFGSGYDLTIRGSEPHIGLCTDSAESAWDSLFPSFSAHPHQINLKKNVSQ